MKEPAIKKFWFKATAPRATSPDEALREYMTRVTSLLMGFTAFLFTIVFFTGWVLSHIPFDTIIIMIVLTLIFFCGWKLADRGYWKTAGYLPPLFVFLTAVYGNIIGGPGAPAMILYAVSIVLTAILQGHRAQWIAVILSSLIFAAIGLAEIQGLIQQTRTPESHFTNRVVIVAISYTAIAALLWFLVSQYRMALNRARSAAAELEAYSAELTETNQELETEIAERRRAENALHESEERYRTLFDFSRDAIIAIEPPSWKITTANRTFDDMFRVADGANEHSRLAVNDISPVIQPDDEGSGEKFERMAAKAMAEGGCFFEWQFRRIDGNEFPGTILLSKCVVSDGSFLQATIRDVTERKRSQELIELSEEKYRGLVEKTLIGIATISPRGEFSFANEAMSNMIGYRDDELIGKQFIDFIHPDDRERILESFRSSIRESRDRLEIEFRVIHRDGTVVHMYSTPTKYRFRDTLLGYNAIILDITERKKAEEQIKSSLKEKEVLLKEIHHRVKNNFQIIISLINLQSNSIKDPALLKMFHDSTNRIRAMALVHEKLYRSEDIAKIDFTSYLRTIAEELHGSYTTTLNSPHLSIEADDMHLGVDHAIPCGLIVNELITNALKYAFPNGGEGNAITISLRHSGPDDITLIVTDNGIGIPEAIDIDNTTSLGLQLVNVLIKQIHGTRTVSRAGGTSWTITFPITE